jgi:hypothetical protein
MYFPYSQCYLHKIEFGKGLLKARRNTLDTREPRTEISQYKAQTCNFIQRVKPALELLQSR